MGQYGRVYVPDQGRRRVDHGDVCHFGTVEPSYKLVASDFRVSPGFGIRLTIPAMGPAIAGIDFAFPIVKAPTDQLQIFNFNVGVADKRR